MQVLPLVHELLRSHRPEYLVVKSRDLQLGHCQCNISLWGQCQMCREYKKKMYQWLTHHDYKCTVRCDIITDRDLNKIQKGIIHVAQYL